MFDIRGGAGRAGAGSASGVPTCACSCGDEHPAVPLKAVPTVAEVAARAAEVAQQREERLLTARPPLEWELRHPVAARLEKARPSPDLARDLAGLVAADVDDPGLVEMTAAWERVLSWASAAQSEVVAEMLRRANGPREEGFVADEIAAATGVTPRAGRNVVERAAALMRAPEVHDALADGTLTTRKADTLCRSTAHLPRGQATVVHRAVLAHGSRLTAPQIRATARRVELELDPTAADRRHEAARRTRSVWMEPAEDCMAYVHAYLPAPDAMRVMTAVDAVAASAGRDDERGIDARRADALVDVLSRVLDRGVGPDGVDLPVTKRRRPHLTVTLNLSTLLGFRDDPAVLAGYGPIGAEMAREIAAQGAWTFTLVHPRTGEVLERSSKGYRPSPRVLAAVVDRAPTCTFPGCGVAASWCDIDHITPFDRSRPAQDQTRTDGLQPLCRHHHVMKTHGRWTPQRDPETGVTTWRSRTGQVYTRDPVPAPFEPGPPGLDSTSPDPTHHGPASDPGPADHRAPDDPGAIRPPPNDPESPGERRRSRARADREGSGAREVATDGDPPF
ncbi:MAG: DUF222 domain-containing protein [Actinotalea sp.]|nr:DUF222 domain-containing protein [Actinotalea sp.]